MIDNQRVIFVKSAYMKDYQGEETIIGKNGGSYVIDGGLPYERFNFHKWDNGSKISKCKIPF